MPFPGSKPATAPTTAQQAQAAPTPPGAPAPPNAPQPPAAPQPPPASARKFWVGINGQSVLKTEAECAQLPPTTQAMPEDQSTTWAPLSSYLGAAAAAATGAAAGGRSSFQRPGAAAPVGGPADTDVPKTLFAGVENAQVLRKGAYLEEGDYIMKLCSIEYKKGRNKNQVIAEMEVITSSYDGNDPGKQKCNQEGSRVTIFIAHNDSFASNMKEIVLAVSGFDEHGKHRDATDVVSQEECNALISKEQPYAGAHVYIEARQIKTKAGGDFTRANWWPCPLKADGTPDTDKLFRDVR